MGFRRRAKGGIFFVSWRENFMCSFLSRYVFIVVIWLICTRVRVIKHVCLLDFWNYMTSDNVKVGYGSWLKDVMVFDFKKFLIICKILHIKNMLVFLQAFKLLVLIYQREAFVSLKIRLHYCDSGICCISIFWYFIYITLQNVVFFRRIHFYTALDNPINLSLNFFGLCICL